MKKVLIAYIVFLISMATTQAQQNNCGLPTCEEPADPGFATPAAGRVSVYPNPASSGRLWVKLNKFKNQRVAITIFDANDKPVSSRTISDSKAEEMVAFDLPQEKIGIYVVQVITKTETIALQVL